MPTNPSNGGDAFNPIPLHEAKVGDFLLMPSDGSAWIIDSEEKLMGIPAAAFYYQSLGMDVPLVFEFLWEAQYYLVRN